MVPQLHQAKNKTTSGITENFLAFNMNFSLKNGEQKVKSCQSCLCTQTTAQAVNNPRPMGCHTGAGGEGLGTGMVSDNPAG